MKRNTILAAALAAAYSLTGCNWSKGQSSSQAEDPPEPQVEQAPDGESITVEHPDLFALAAVSAHAVVPSLSVTGVVAADVSRNVPVNSLASGRAIEVHARLGDRVTKGQLLMRIQSSDISSAFSDYGKAAADERLTSAALGRAKLLFSKGAVAQKDLEVADDAEADARAGLQAAVDRLKVLGADLAHPSPVVDILAPVSGVIIEQNVTAAAGVKSLDDAPNLFTIADLSHVWILCDVHENDLPRVHLNDLADVRLNAYPDKVFQGRVSDIGAILDPNIRTAKARIELDNPGAAGGASEQLMRLGMFVQATFHDQQKHMSVLAPASAILHLHDRDWVYVPKGPNAFRRVEVHSFGTAGGGQQVLVSGLRPGQRVVANALLLQKASEQRE
ncbi:MAG TPA: efflux RND transporter periplasmic adaptor subunit [Bryobacteraceae bacterium]|nr:efflux RND transporter periplasmic adaptor subunit [Bryobacteraceae bacterium]